MNFCILGKERGDACMQFAIILQPFTLYLCTDCITQALLQGCWGVVRMPLKQRCLQFKDHLSTHGHLISLKNKQQQSSLNDFQHQYLSELLVNAYSYHMMVKSVSCCCVCRKRLFSNPVTNAGNCILYFTQCSSSAISKHQTYFAWQ